MSTPSTIEAQTTFSRASTKLAFGQAGTLVTIASGSKAYDFDPATLLPLGILLEPASTNLALHSNDLSGNSPAQATITANAAVAPDGTTTASSLIESSSTSAHYAQLANLAGTGSPGASNLPYTYSIFVKPAGRDGFQASLIDTSASTAAVQLAVSGLNGSTPTISTPVFSGGVVNSSGARKCANGWWRIWANVLLTSTAGGTITRQGIILNSGVGNYAGDNASGVYLWGEQIEQTARLVPTSPIVTAGTALSRAFDALSLSNMATEFNAAQGTALVHFTPRSASASGGHGLVRFDDTTNNNRIELSNPGGTSNLQMDVVSGGSSLFSGVAGTLTPFGLSMLAMSWANGAWAVSLNGAVAVTGSNAGLPSGLTRGILGADDLAGTHVLGGWIKRFRLWPTAFSAADLATLTASENAWSAGL